MNVLEIVEYMDTDGGIYRVDFSRDSAGQELDHGKLLELCSYAQMMAEAPIMADLVYGYIQHLQEDDE
ncbi:hypothetical protein [Mycolicibacterium septicum]|uniref:hypothetical protein n=1 Tax=Mycolicibacterium septicum TaxID=98668 RepID=UPI001AF9F7B7|nr:hypothetical protein [Mycolicibacterium septicum]QRY51773.1 hypothetical protein JVX95_31105 [Mycolicibacterium septicum]